ncbi:MAG TPA: hypothetical protein VFG87_15125 [Amycolatopsis sp.]|nr:hypothetical protein [Amycolatopsis sp.]
MIQTTYVGRHRLVVTNQHAGRHRSARRPFLVALVRSFRRPAEPVLAGLNIAWGLR